MEPAKPGENREIGAAGDSGTPAKKPYAAPRLTAYGHISKLTASGASGSKSDFPPKAKKKTCL